MYVFTACLLTYMNTEYNTWIKPECYVPTCWSITGDPGSLIIRKLIESKEGGKQPRMPDQSQRDRDRDRKQKASNLDRWMPIGMRPSEERCIRLLMQLIILCHDHCTEKSHGRSARLT